MARHRVESSTLSINIGKPRLKDMFPEAEELLNRCKGKIQEAAEQLSKQDGSLEFVINRHQCDLLVTRLSRVERILAYIEKSELVDGSKILGILGELLETLFDADALIRSSCVRTSDWPRVGIEQGDMKETFSTLLYEVKWCTDILLSSLKDNSNMPRFTFGAEDCDGNLSKEDEFDRAIAIEADKESLKKHLMSVKLDGSTKKELAHQLLKQMEAPSSGFKLLSLDPKDLKGFEKKGEVIASGAFGTVLRTTFLGAPCALKVVTWPGPEAKIVFQKELDAIKALGNHPNLVRLFCYSEEDKKLYLIMEKMEMDLANALSLKLPIMKAVSLMLQIAEGVKHIHSKGVAHRDLKPENVLVNLGASSSESFPRICSVKIADFGISKTKEASKTYSNQTVNTGTFRYMAPEVIKLREDDVDGKPKFNPRKADVYSFGILCAAILNGKHPYDDYEGFPKQMKRKVRDGELRPTLPADPTECPPRLGILIRRCWAGDASVRPQFDWICRELRYIKGLLLRGDEEKLRIAGLEALDLVEVLGAKVEAACGGEGGQKFLDIGTSIRRIKVAYCGRRVWQMEVTYELFGNSFTRKYGGGNSAAELTEMLIVIGELEFISSITVYGARIRGSGIDHGVHSLVIQTNLRMYDSSAILSMFGLVMRSRSVSVRGKVIGFHGTASDRINSLGAIIIPDANG